MPERHDAYRDGIVHVQRRRCSTCIFRGGNLMHLDDGRVDDMCAQADRNDSAIICHDTLDGLNSVCRGYYDRYSSSTLRLAEAVGVIEFDDSGPPITA